MKKKRKTPDDPPTFIGWAVQTKVCPECKKPFDWYGEQWVYRQKHNGKMQYYCSWTCWRAKDRRKETKLRGEGYLDYGERKALHADAHCSAQ